MTRIGGPGPRLRTLSTLTLTSADQRGALCATFPHDRMAGGRMTTMRNIAVPKGIVGKDPVAIQSLSVNDQERRNNSAQKTRSSSTPLGERGPLCASYTILIPREAYRAIYHPVRYTLWYIRLPPNTPCGTPYVHPVVHPQVHPWYTLWYEVHAAHRALLSPWEEGIMRRIEPSFLPGKRE